MAFGQPAPICSSQPLLQGAVDTLVSGNVVYFPIKLDTSVDMQSINTKIISRIYGHGQGWAFSPRDFVSDFSPGQIENALSRLCREGKIRRVCRGIYDYPRFSDLLKRNMSPDYDQVARALARRFNWRIQPSGDASLNLLGLSTQVPGSLIYLSDGPNRRYEAGPFVIEFRKVPLKDIGFKYRQSGMVVHALKALGEPHVDDRVIAKLRRQLSDADRRRVLKDTVTATGWVYEAIKKICKGGDSN